MRGSPRLRSYLAMSAKRKKKERPTFVAENGNVQIPIYTIKRGRLDKEVKVLAAV